MAITELIFPALKTDRASIEEVERDWPVLGKGLTHPNPGLLNAFRGWIVEEDGKDTRDSGKEFLLFGEFLREESLPGFFADAVLVCVEWDKMDSFHAFVGSEQFAAFASSIKHLVTGPPKLQVFETNLGPRDAASAHVVEVIRVSVANAEDASASLQVWGQISRHLTEKHGKGVSVTYGKSSNLEKDVVVGIIGWQNTEVRLDNFRPKCQCSSYSSAK